MGKKAPAIAGYAVLFAVAAAIFILHGVDGESVRPGLEAAFKEKTGADLRMKRLDLSLPFSATLVDVELASPEGKVKIRLDSLEIRPVYWKLLLLSPTVRLTMRMNDGWMSLDASPALLFGRTSARLEAEKFPMGKALVTLGGSEAPMAAEISATAEVSAPRNSPADATGKASLTLENIRLKAGSEWASLLTGLAPQSAKCSLEVMDRKLRTKDCSASSPMGSAELRAASRISDDASASALSGAVVVAPKGKMIDAFSLLYPRYRKPDGAYYIPLSGTLSDPKFGL